MPGCIIAMARVNRPALMVCAIAIKTVTLTCIPISRFTEGQLERARLAVARHWILYRHFNPMVNLSVAKSLKMSELILCKTPVLALELVGACTLPIPVRFIF